MDHLGVEVETTDLVLDAHHRLADAGLFPRPEDDTTCCYAVQDEVRVTGRGQEAWCRHRLDGLLPIVAVAGGETE